MALSSLKPFATAAAVLTAIAAPAHAGEIWVTVDQARAVKLERPAQSIVIGNPAIADITVQNETGMFVLGKTPGVTNLIAVDSQGDEIANIAINVSGARSNFVTLNRGEKQYTFSCAHRCESTIMVGDETNRFSAVSGQADAKSVSASDAADAAVTSQ